MTRRPAGPLELFAPGLFAGTTALVTGGGRGLGKVVAVGFARLGANVVLAGIEDEIEEAASEIEELGVDCLAVKTNIREVAEVDALRDAAIARFGAVDFVINNAGGQFIANPTKISDRAWRSVVDLNLNGTWNMCSRFMTHLAERGSGAIVNSLTGTAAVDEAPRSE